ncbi:MAG: PHP domain-containing protein [Dehalococcoidia bacterium]|jgi:predicted metal-dependent phosphoesterase TrpH|nr:PHP domain-containing protein [Dehalococcoidia bacterium]MDW8008004.1 PHP domain-containing protein [Chloroflexota bacterium]
MPSRADLHTHSTYSDGVLTPKQLVDYAYSRGVRILALTDHDITDGIPEALEAARAYPDMLLIPGIEMSTDVPGNEVHVLGYFIDWQDAEFQRVLARLRDSRVDRARRMVERLAELGVPVSWERVRELAGEGAVGRPHIAQALVEAGHVSSVNEAFELYLGRNRPAYVEREKMTPAEVVQLLRKVGGLAVLAHPRELEGQLDGLLPELKAAGLVGMEVYYQDYTPEEIQRLLAWARRFDLLPLGGSDYHGLGGPQQREPGDIPLPDEPVQQLLALAAARPA